MVSHLSCVRSIYKYNHFLIIHIHNDVLAGMIFSFTILSSCIFIGVSIAHSRKARLQPQSSSLFYADPYYVSIAHSRKARLQHHSGEGTDQYLPGVSIAHSRKARLQPRDRGQMRRKLLHSSGT
jgi:hypothetical protein